MLAVDAYLRGGEWSCLRKRDILVSGSEVAIKVERTKTGRNQGVRIDWPRTMQMLLERILHLQDDDLIFSIDVATFRRLWYRA